MWVAKIKFSESGTLIGSKAEKFRINLFVFPLSFFYEKNWIIVHFAGTMIGNEKDKKDFIISLKKEKRTINLEVNNDFIIGTIREPLYAKVVYNKDILHLAPALISDKGYEVITIGSYKRDLLMRSYDALKKKQSGELLSIQDKKVSSISVMKLHPDLTAKQKKAIELAIKRGYYDSPRKTSVEELAKLSGLSFSTYQVHLRKAEKKLIPYFFE